MQPGAGTAPLFTVISVIFQDTIFQNVSPEFILGVNGPWETHGCLYLQTLALIGGLYVRQMDMV